MSMLRGLFLGLEFAEEMLKYGCICDALRESGKGGRPAIAGDFWANNAMRE